MSLAQFRMGIVPGDAGAADLVLQESPFEGWSLIEDVIEGRAWILGIGADHGELLAQWRTISASMAEQGVRMAGEPELQELADQDWKESYKAHFRAWRFGPLHWVPEWERETHAVPEGESVLWLDPGLAFGTGNHETTRLCCEDLVEFAARRSERGWEGRRRMIDAGCGSGILALSAALLGLSPVFGFDNDPEAVRVSGENARANRLEDRVTFSIADIAAGLSGREADLLVANIQADVLVRFRSELLAPVAPGGWLVLSGILAQELESVRDAFAGSAPGWDVSTRTMGGWSSVRLVRP